MSGRSSGLALLPIVGLAYPPLGIALLGGAIAVGVARSVQQANRAEKARQEREAIRAAREAQRLRNLENNRRQAAMNPQQDVWSGSYSAQQNVGNTNSYVAQQNVSNVNNYVAQQQINRVAGSIDSFRSSAAANIKEQTRLNVIASNQMTSELEKSRNEMLDIINTEDPVQYQKYLQQMDKSKSELTKKLNIIQDTYVKEYHTKIAENMDAVSKEMNAQYASYLDELNKLQADAQQKKEMASGLANDYIEEAKELLTELQEDYNGQKYSGNRMLELQNAINDAVSQYNIGNYEAAIAVAKDSTLAIMEEIYKADCKQQEWDNYYKLALMVSSELVEFIKGQEVITAEAKAKVEQKLGKEIEDDIVGVNVSEYTCKREDGKTEYEYLLEQAEKIFAMLDADDVKDMSVEQLKDCVELVNNKLYPAASRAIFEGILNMSNAFSRQNISEEIIDFFEEHNFNFTGYSYDDDKHDGALRIGLENETTGEEIIITLAPELMANGEVQTRVDIDQLKGDETNEARKEFYRQSVTDCVAGNTPGAQIKLECRHETKNKLSEKTELRDRLR